MKYFYHFKIVLVLFLYYILNSCTEPYALQTNSFEEALVVEATISNEFKNQEIKITKTYRFEDNGPSFESDAEVFVTDDLGNLYTFEAVDKLYVSTDKFQAIPSRIYRLTIRTKEGKTYTSSAETLTTINNMQDIVPTVAIQNGKRGIVIKAKSFDPSKNSKFYRYEYEETYKIIAPLWNPFKAIIVPAENGAAHDSIGVILRDDTEIKTCYSTFLSNDILLTSTSDLSEDRVDYPVRFINNDNPIIAHRYSILVRQYIQNFASYTFYKTIKELSGSESILSQNQPGFFYGNIKSVNNPNEKVIGFFEVASVSTKRIFFNYETLFPNEAAAPYFVDCTSRKFKFCFINADPECKGAILLSIISANDLLYLSDKDDLYYFMALPPCVDCTKIATNIKPIFWID